MSHEQRRVLRLMRQNPDVPVSARTAKTRMVTLDNLMRRGLVDCRLGGNGDLLHPQDNDFYRLTAKGREFDLEGEG
jgi:hypothetical protein